MPSRLVAVSAAAVLCFAGAAAFAQGNPSADSIINSLRPGSGIGGLNRGIRPVGPSSSESSAPQGRGTRPPSQGVPVASPGTRHVAPGAATAGAEPSAPSVNLTVEFANNSADLTPAATHTLDELGRALSSQALSGYRFRIEGHTDAIGSRDHNQMLSEQRAQKVVDYLVSKFSVDRSRVEAVGLGEEQPLVPNRPNVPEPRNRRVTVINLGA
jgi:outer membrane protein OmpA-like peptidoglycan-associated protein